MFTLEKEFVALALQERQKLKDQKSKPLMEEFFRWLRSLTASMAASCCVGDAAKGTAGIRVTTDA